MKHSLSLILFAFVVFTHTKDKNPGSKDKNPSAAKQKSKERNPPFATKERNSYSKDRNPCSGAIFNLGCKIFELAKRNAAARKEDLNRRLDLVRRRHQNDTKHIIHLIAENVESLSEEQAAEIGMVTKQTEDKLKRLKHLLKEKINQTNASVFNKTHLLLTAFKNDIAELKGMILKPDPKLQGFFLDGKKLKGLEDNIKHTINKSRDNYEMKFLLTAKYVGEKYANLETKVNNTVRDVRDIMKRLENSTDVYKKGFKEMRKDLEKYINMSSPATKLEVARVEESIHKKYSMLTKAVNESIVKVETDLEKAIGKKWTSREKIGGKVESEVEKEIDNRLKTRYSTLEDEVSKNITRATGDLKKSIESDMDSRYASLKTKVYKNLSVITGSVMRDIVLITQNIKDMWKSTTGSKKSWPDGHYCLYKYGQCPDSFVERRSHVHKKSIYCCKKN